MYLRVATITSMLILWSFKGLIIREDHLYDKPNVSLVTSRREALKVFSKVAKLHDIYNVPIEIANQLEITKNYAIEAKSDAIQFNRVVSIG